ncbi:hypothetical protein BDW59DRAFT_161710 [Aspergillus cavernicola]|uniref:Uncharacterized protein n=1 Tax=Aspergillus cavernicola TaxID=176166 RepID=A0ABR4ICM6_9EURO
MASHKGIPGEIPPPKRSILGVPGSRHRQYCRYDLKLDPSASNSANLSILQTALTEKLLALEANRQPSTLHDKNYGLWRDLKSSLSYVHEDLGDVDAQEKTLLEILSNPGPAGKDLPALQNLSALYHPQALGSLRTLVKVLWKQGKTAEAEEYVGQARASIDNLAGTQFAKYQQEERDALDRVVADLKCRIHFIIITLCTSSQEVEVFELDEYFRGGED